MRSPNRRLLSPISYPISSVYMLPPETEGLLERAQEFRKSLFFVWEPSVESVS